MSRPIRHLRRAARATLLAAALLAAGCGREDAQAAELVVSAAASLTEVMTELAAGYQRANPGVVIRNNFAASGTLEQQIRHGSGVDLFVSAAARQVDALEADGLTVPGSGRVLAGNELVLVVPRGGAGGVRGFADLGGAGVGRVAIGAPASVPAGAYARTALQGMGLWGAVEPKAVLTASVRQALTYVERGEVDAALVYRTDALRARGVRVVAAAPPAAHPPIVYPAALVAGSDHPEAARRYLDHLAGPEAAAVFRRHGFAPAPPGTVR